MIMTPKQFREYLNEKHGFLKVNASSKATGARKRAYGDYLYFSDRDMFDYNLKTFNDTPFK